MFVEIPSWPARDEAADILMKDPITRVAFMDLYRRHIDTFITDDFYTIVESRIPEYAEYYRIHGEINLPLLKPSCLPQLAEWSTGLEAIGNVRYNTVRTVYPPGEVKRFKDDDPRKGLVTGVNMTAVAARHMHSQDDIQWIYHSPHFQLFVQGVMGFSNMFPYYSDLGIAINIMRPVQDPAQTALGFHFDTIDSSIQVDQSGNQNARGATGVIGIQDCSIGGERITFTNISRDKVDKVRDVVRNFDPLHPKKEIAGSSPEVAEESIAGVLSVFNGGNVLHGVSSVREGLRIAAVFLY
ncbi:unnamed protein product, partial [Ectocarpus fasciculatus]